MSAKSIIYTLSAASLLAACSGTEKWSVDGNVNGAADKTIYLEVAHNGNWAVIDSASIGSDGSFNIKAPRPAYPEIYRLTIDGRSAYIPVDSTETLTLEATLDNFDNGYTVAGSPSADKLTAINRRVNQAVAAGSKISGDSALKRDVANLLQNDWGGIVAYYAINKSVGSEALFDPSNSFDRRVINAVANIYTSQSPDDPRTALLKNMSLTNRMMYGTSRQMKVEETLFPEIELNDQHGNPRSLTKEWEKGRVIVLNFTVYGAKESPAFNMALANLYRQYKDLGLEIYQVACDDDEYLWLDAAKNIPWISVYNLPSKAGNALLRYNVSSVPTTFVISRDGQSLQRVDDIDKLTSTVAKFI